MDGSSPLSGPAAIQTGRNNARNEALERAAAKGATHIHWLVDGAGGGGVRVTAEAFNCDVPRPPSEEGDDYEPVATATRASPAPTTADSRDAKQKPISWSTGTCFFVSNTGLALTSLHIVRDSQSLLVIDSQGRKSQASVLAKDEKLDLVALQVDTNKVPQVMPLATSEAALGDHVFTIGFPEVVDLGFDPKLTEGSISGERGLGFDFLLQTSAPVQPGNSGGALINEAGNVVGIVALRQNYFSDGAAATNTAFAVKATSIRSAFRSLSIATGAPLRDRKAAIARARAASCLVAANITDPGHRPAAPATTPPSEASQSAPSPGDKEKPAISPPTKQEDTSAPPEAEALDRSMIAAAVAEIMDRIRACGKKWPADGVVRVHVRVDSEGHVANASVSETPDEGLGACVVAAVRKATFAKTKNGGSFSYPFTF